MHLSRGVLVALALGASDAAARPQLSFNFGAKNTPEVHSSSHSNPEPSTSAVQAVGGSPSWAGNLFKGWYGGFNQHTSSQSDNQKASVTSNNPQTHTSAPNVGGPSGFFNGLKPEFASQTTVAEAISIAGHIYSDFSGWERKTKPTSHHSDDQIGKSQYGNAGKQAQAGMSASLIPHAGISQSDSRPPVPTGAAEALPGFFKGLESTLKNQGRQSQYSRVREIESHVMSDVEQWKQGQKPTSVLKDDNTLHETGISHARKSSTPKNPSGSHLSAPTKSRNGDSPRPSSETTLDYSHSTSSSKAAGEITIASGPRIYPTKASGQRLTTTKSVISEARAFKSSGHGFATQSGELPKASGDGRVSGQPELQTTNSNGWLDGLISRLRPNPTAASQKSSISAEGVVKNPGAFHATASISRFNSKPSPLPEPAVPSVESYLENLPKGLSSKSAEEILGGAPGLSIPGDVLDYLRKLPSQYKTVPLESYYPHRPTVAPSTSVSFDAKSLSRDTPVPTNFQSYIDNLPSGRGSLPINSFLGNQQLPGEIRSFLHDLPPGLATSPIGSLAKSKPPPSTSTSHGFQTPTTSLPRISFPASVPGKLNSALHNLPADATALPVNSILSKYPNQLPADTKSLINGLPSEEATLLFGSFQNGFTHPTPGRGSDTHVPTGLHGSVVAQPTQWTPLESALQSALEHSKLPGSTGLQASALPFPDSLEPLQSAFESYLSRGDINVPTGFAESAINHYFGTQPTWGAHLPSPSNAVESVTASLYGGLDSPSKLSAHSSEGGRITPVLSSLHFGPGPVIVATRSGEKVTQISPSKAASNVLSSLGSESAAKETRKPATTSGPTLPTIPGALSGISESSYLTSETSTPSRLPSRESRPLKGSSSARKMPSSPSSEPVPASSTRPPSLPSQLSALKSELSHANTPLSNPNGIANAAKSLMSEIPTASTDRDPFSPFKPLPTPASLSSETNPHSTRPSNTPQPRSSVRSSIDSFSGSFKSAAASLSRPLPASQLSASLPTEKTVSSTPKERQTTSDKESPLGSRSLDLTTRTHGQEPGFPTIFTTLPYFSKLSTLLGASAASSILAQTTHVVPTDGPKLSSFLEHLSTVVALSTKSTPAGPSLPGFSRLSSGAPGLSKASETLTQSALRSQTEKLTQGLPPSELSALSPAISASKVSEISGQLTFLPVKPTYTALRSEFSMLSSAFGASRASENLVQPTSHIQGGKATQGPLPSELSHWSFISGPSQASESPDQLTSKTSEFRTSTGLALHPQVTQSSSASDASRASEKISQLTSKIIESGKPAEVAPPSGLSRQSSLLGTSRASAIPGSFPSDVVPPGQSTKGLLPSENSGLLSAHSSSEASTMLGRSSSQASASGRSMLANVKSNPPSLFSAPEPSKAPSTFAQLSSQMGNSGRSTHISRNSDFSKLSSKFGPPSSSSLIDKVTSNLPNFGKPTPLSEPSGTPISSPHFEPSKASSISGRFPTSFKSQGSELFSLSSQIRSENPKQGEPTPTSLPLSELRKISSISESTRAPSVLGRSSTSGSAGGSKFPSLTGRMNSEFNVPTSLSGKASISLWKSLDAHSLLPTGRPQYTQILNSISSELRSESNLLGVSSKLSSIGKQVPTALPTAQEQLSSILSKLSSELGSATKIPEQQSFLSSLLGQTSVALPNGKPPLGVVGTSNPVTKQSSTTSRYSEAASGLGPETALSSIQSRLSSSHGQANYGTTHALSGFGSFSLPLGTASSTSSLLPSSSRLYSSMRQATASALGEGSQMPPISRSLDSKINKSGFSTLAQISNAATPSIAPEPGSPETFSAPKWTGLISHMSSIIYGSPSSIPSKLSVTVQSFKASSGILSSEVSSSAFPENPTKSIRSSSFRSTGVTQPLGSVSTTIAPISSKIEVETRSVRKPSQESVYTSIPESVLSTIFGTDIPKVLPTAISKSIISSLMQSKASEITSRTPASASEASFKYQFSDSTPSFSGPHGMSETRISTVESPLSSRTQGQSASTLLSVSPPSPAKEPLSSSSPIASVWGHTTDEPAAKTTQEPSGMTSTQPRTYEHPLSNQGSRSKSLHSDVLPTDLSSSLPSLPKSETTNLNPTIYLTRGPEPLLSSDIFSKIRSYTPSEISWSSVSRTQSTSPTSSFFNDQSMASKDKTESLASSKPVGVSLSAKAMSSYSAARSESKTSTPIGEQLKPTLSSLPASLGMSSDTLGSAHLSSSSHVIMSRPEQSSASPEAAKSFQASAESSRSQQSEVNVASRFSPQDSTSSALYTESNGMSNTAGGNLGSVTAPKTSSSFQLPSQKGVSIMPSSSSTSNNGRYESVTPSISKATLFSTERVSTALQSSTKRGDHVSETLPSIQATHMPTSSQGGASGSSLPPPSAQSPSERLPGLSSIISSLRARTTSLIVESSLLSSVRRLTSTASLSGSPTAMSTSQLPPLSTSKSSNGASQGPSQETTQSIQRMANSDSSKNVRPSSLMSSAQSRSMKSERTDIPTTTTSMVVATNKESPTTFYSYSETKPLQSLKSVLTTVSLSPEQSSMLAAVRTSISSVTRAPSYPSGSISSKAGFSTPVSLESPRITSSMNSGSIASPFESGFTPREPTEMSSSPLSSSSHSRDSQSSAARSPPGSTSQGLTYSSSSPIQQTLELSSGTPASSKSTVTTQASIQHPETQFSEQQSQPSSFLSASSMKFLSAQSSSMSSASRSASLASEVSRLSSLASHQSEISLSIATRSQESLAPLSSPKMTRPEINTLFSPTAQSGLFATQTGLSYLHVSSQSSNIATNSEAVSATLTKTEASKISDSAQESSSLVNLLHPSRSQSREASEVSRISQQSSDSTMRFATSASNTVKQLSSVSAQSSAVSAMATSTSAMVSQGTSFANSNSDVSTIASDSSAIQPFTGDSSRTLGVGYHSTNDILSRTSRARDSFTTREPSQASSPVTPGAQSSINRFFSSETSQSNVLESTVSSSIHEGSPHILSTTHLEASATVTGQPSRSNELLLSQAQSTQSKTWEHLESSLSISQAHSMLETRSYTESILSETQGTSTLPYSLPVVQTSNSIFGSPVPWSSLVSTAGTSVLNSAASQPSTPSYQSMAYSKAFSSIEQFSAKTTRTVDTVSAEASSITSFSQQRSRSDQPTLPSEATPASSQNPSPNLSLQESGPKSRGTSGVADSRLSGSQNMILTNYVSSTNNATIKPTWIPISKESTAGSIKMGSVRPSNSFSSMSLTDSYSRNSVSNQQTRTQGTQDMASLSSTFQVTSSFTRPKLSTLATSAVQTIPTVSHPPSSIMESQRSRESTSSGALFTSFGSTTLMTWTDLEHASSFPILISSQGRLPSAILTEPSLSDFSKVSVRQTSAMSKHDSGYGMLTPTPADKITILPSSSHIQTLSTPLGPQNTLGTPSTTQRTSASIQTNPVPTFEFQSKLSVSSDQSPTQASVSYAKSNSAIPMTPSSFSSETLISSPSKNIMNSMSSPTSKDVPTAISQSEMTASISHLASSVPSMSVTSHYASRIVTGSQSTEGTITQASYLDLSLGNQQSSRATGIIYTRSLSMAVSDIGGASYISTATRNGISSSPFGSQESPSSTSLTSQATDVSRASSFSSPYADILSSSSRSLPGPETAIGSTSASAIEKVPTTLVGMTTSVQIPYIPTSSPKNERSSSRTLRTSSAQKMTTQVEGQEPSESASIATSIGMPASSIISQSDEWLSSKSFPVSSSQASAPSISVEQTPTISLQTSASQTRSSGTQAMERNTFGSTRQSTVKKQGTFTSQSIPGTTGVMIGPLSSSQMQPPSTFDTEAFRATTGVPSSSRFGEYSSRGSKSASRLPLTESLSSQEPSASLAQTPSSAQSVQSSLASQKTTPTMITSAVRSSIPLEIASGSQSMPSGASGKSKTLASESSQEVQPISLVSETSATGVQHFSYSRISSTSTLQRISEVPYSGQAAYSAVSTSNIPTYSTLFRSHRDNSLSTTPPQTPMGQSSSAQEAVPQPSTSRSSPNTASGTGVLQTSSSYQTYPYSMGYSEPSPSPKISQSPITSRPPKASETMMVSKSRMASDYPRFSEPPKASETSTSLASLGSFSAASNTILSSSAPLSTAPRAPLDKSLMAIESTAPTTVSSMPDSHITFESGLSYSTKGSLGGSLAQPKTSEGQTMESQSASYKAQSQRITTTMIPLSSPAPIPVSQTVITSAISTDINGSTTLKPTLITTQTAGMGVKGVSESTLGSFVESRYTRNSISPFSTSTPEPGALDTLVDKSSSSSTDAMTSKSHVPSTSSKLPITSGAESAFAVKESSNVRLPFAPSTEAPVSENSLPVSIPTQSQVSSRFATLTNAASTPVAALTQSSVGLSSLVSESRGPIDGLSQATRDVKSSSTTMLFTSKSVIISKASVSGAVPSQTTSAPDSANASTSATLAASDRETPSAPPIGSTGLDLTGATDRLKPTQTSSSVEQNMSASVSYMKTVGSQPSSIANFQKVSQLSTSKEASSLTSVQSGNMLMSGSQTAATPRPTQESPVGQSSSPAKPSNGSPTSPAPTSLGARLQGSSIYSTEPQSSNVSKSASHSQTEEMMNSGQSHSIGTLQAPGSTETMFTLQTFSPPIPQSETFNTGAPQPTSLHETSRPMKTEEPQQSTASSQPTKSGLDNEMSSTSEMLTAESLTMTSPTTGTSLPAILSSKNTLGEISSAQRLETTKVIDSTIPNTAPTTISLERFQGTTSVDAASGLVTRPESEISTAVWTTTVETVSSYTTYCPAPTTVVQGDKTYTVTEATTLTITECPCTHTKTFQNSIASTTANAGIRTEMPRRSGTGGIEVQPTGQVASVISQSIGSSQNSKEQPSEITPAQSQVSDANKEPDVTEVPGETASRGEISMAAQSLPVESNPSTVSVVYATETIFSKSNHRLAATDSTDTSLLHFGTSPPADIGSSSPASVSQSDTSSSPAVEQIAPINTEKSSKNNDGEPQPPSNIQPDQREHGHELTTSNTGQPGSSLPSQGPHDQDPTSPRNGQLYPDQPSQGEHGQGLTASGTVKPGSNQPSISSNNEPGQEEHNQGSTSSSDKQLGSPNQLPNSSDGEQLKEPSPAMTSNGIGSSTESNEQPPVLSDGTNEKSPVSTGRESERFFESDRPASGTKNELDERPSDPNELDKQGKSGIHTTSAIDPPENQNGPSQGRPSSSGANSQHPQEDQNPGGKPTEPSIQSEEQNNTPQESSEQSHKAQSGQDRSNAKHTPVSSYNGIQKENDPAHQGIANQQSPQSPAVNKGVNQGPAADQQQPQQPSRPNNGVDQGRPATQLNHDGLTFAPILSDTFNFYNGAVFDPAGNSMTSGSDRMAEAREINANLPVEIQKAFNDNSINYYHPGIGEFYYNKMCGDTDCSIVQVAKSCDCYVSGSDQQLHYLTFGEDGNLEKSIFNSQANLPPATKHSVNSGDTLFAIAERYGVDLSIILGANKDITNPDVIAVGQVIQIPSQAYKVVEGDYLDAIAKNYGVSLSALKALNGQIENHDLIFPGQMIRVPPKRLGDPFSTTVESGDSLSSIADKWGVSLASVEALNPEIEDKDLIFPNQVVKISLYMPVQGNLTTTNSCPTCEADEKAAALTGAKFARAVTAPKLIATTIEVGPTATPIVAKVPAVSGSKGFVENNSWVGKASRQLFRLI